MRDILPIAHFECTQIANWRPEKAAMSAYDICENIRPVRERLERNTIDASHLLHADFICGLSTEIAQSMHNCPEPEFQRANDWDIFMRELTIEFEISEIPFSESGSYIITQLFSKHLTVLRLLTSWLVVDKLARVLGEKQMTISQSGLGLLLADLSIAGPPICDVEDMRSAFPNRYR